MRILRITIHNIASLAGTHSIDFTREPLRSAGLYGISGATGAGKSSVLDALCLALFDATPRLKQVGKLEQTIDGENQKSPGTLLRRGTSSGFAEVAFAGVDQKTWTARWRIRRSHHRPDGKLQPAEMTLFRGNVRPGEEGPVEAGAKKTLVLQAIVEKIGLTFDQFTRAVLLAQNEFATFLRAGDRERAEILQALTGTEQFERISRAVFARSSEEKRKLEDLTIRLAGNAPLSVEERAAAEAAYGAAAERVRHTEAEQRRRESHSAWFAQLKTRQTELNQAVDRLGQAKTDRDSAMNRARELEQTETAIREASVLWTSQEAAATAAETAGDAVIAATGLLETRAKVLEQVRADLDAANQSLHSVTAECEANQPLLRQARQLDARLTPLQEQASRSAQSLSAAQAALRDATSAWTTANTQRDLLLSEQQQQETKLKELDSFAPFVSESAKWLHLLRECITAETAGADTARRVAELNHRRTVQQEQLCAARGLADQTEQLWTTAQRQLSAAEAAEAEFDAAELVRQRRQCDDEFLLLTTLTQELERYDRMTAEEEALSTELVELERANAAESVTLEALVEREIPAAERDVRLATQQLQLVEAAVDDHARRLRTKLQDDLPCPVCGSKQHPYLQHAPDPEFAGVQAARQHVLSLEQTRDALQEQHRRKLLSVESVTAQINRHKDQLATVRGQLQEATFSNQKSDLVKSVLELPVGQRLPAVQRQQTEIVQSRERLQSAEAAFQQAQEHVRDCRKTAEAARQRCETLRQEQTQCDRQLAEINVECAAAETAFRETEARRNKAAADLTDLWSGQPNAVQQFDSDPEAFCETFETSTAEYSKIAEELTSRRLEIEKGDARLVSLEEAAELARRRLATAEADHESAADALTAVLQQRRQLFDGRDADHVEAEITARQQAARDSVEQRTAACHQADKDRQSARQQLESATSSLSEAVATLQLTHGQLADWIDGFAARCSRRLTIDELRLMLERGEDWIRTERGQLKRLDDEVTRAQSAADVHTLQLREHEQRRPTADDEETVITSLVALEEELAAAKACETNASAVLTSDDRRRRENAELADQLTKQEGIADPWFRLNDLIGSREGDKFRMIAQRHTLDVLLNSANHQLSQLAARYRLERLTESLNLIVIDEHMGDERRSVHSLSGGESFLVSLALALGLASLTSGRMKIESLFIDEGFGSLDPETLNTAMSALMHLEAQGRKVGVISHVTEMTDAIPVQVQVVKRRGGASKIVLPGVVAAAVRDVPVTSQTAVSGDAASTDARSIAGRIVRILEREHSAGKHKVSSRALRQELGCESREFRAAQKLLQGRVSVDGRSLRLR